MFVPRNVCFHFLPIGCSTNEMIYIKILSSQIDAYETRQINMNFKVLIDVEKKIALLLVIREKQNNPYLVL